MAELAKVPLAERNPFLRAATRAESALIASGFLIIWAGSLLVDLISGERLPLLVRAAAGLVTLLAVAGVLVLVTAIRNPTPFADLQAGTIHVGSRTTLITDFTTATLVQPGPRIKRQSLKLVSEHETVFLELRDRRGRPTAAPIREAIAEVLRRSSISMPATPEDPQGRFAIYNFPDNLTREQAIALATAADE